jgi:hypothetical protein
MLTTLITLAEKFETELENKDSNNYGGVGKFELPSKHKALVVLNSGSFSCANCKYVDVKNHSCNNKYYQQWNGGDSKLPDAPLNKICSDWFEH